RAQPGPCGTKPAARGRPVGEGTETWRPYDALTRPARGAWSGPGWPVSPRPIRVAGSPRVGDPAGRGVVLGLPSHAASHRDPSARRGAARLASWVRDHT